MADSKWGGIAVWASKVYEASLPAFFRTSEERQAKVEAELRRRVEPLLEAAELIWKCNCANGRKGVCEKCAKALRKELATWQSK